MHLVLSGELVESDTTVFAAGARVIVLRTASADRGVLLYSTYAGHDDLAVVAVTELLELGAYEPLLITRKLEVDIGALTYSRRFALYDHLQRLQQHIRESGGGELKVAGLDVAVRQLDPAVATDQPCNRTGSVFS